MRQLTLASASFDKHSKQTRRAKFLAEMDRVVPWPELSAVVEPFYPRSGNGRPPVGLERMLRLHFLQHWFNLSDPAARKGQFVDFIVRSTSMHASGVGVPPATRFNSCVSLHTDATMLRRNCFGFPSGMSLSMYICFASSTIERPFK